MQNDFLFHENSGTNLLPLYLLNAYITPGTWDETVENKKTKSLVLREGKTINIFNE